MEQILTAGIHQEQGLANVVGNLHHIHSPFISVLGRFPGMCHPGVPPNQKSGVFSISLSIELSTGSNRKRGDASALIDGGILPGVCELCLIILYPNC